MNLHGFLAQNGIPYESKEAIEFVDTFFRIVNYWTIFESTEIAKEKQESFYGYEGSDYYTGKYFDRYDEHFFIESDKVRNLFEDVFIPQPKDWEELHQKVVQDGMYNSYLSAIAPYYK